MENNWFRNSIFYSLDVETYYDSNGDGIGDFQGLIAKLDYIAGLGANCIWLLPFYPSPNRDNGYDITDYYSVDPRLGSLGDFVQFIDKAKNAGIKVVIDLVVNHTSIQHPWFQEARKDRSSPFRNYYVWSDEPLENDREYLILEGEENALWTFDERAGQYYLHRFYKEQPDLNIACPELREEILKIMGYWLSLGVSGFRIDAAEILIDSYGIQNGDDIDLTQFLNDMREFMVAKRSDAVLLAEVNIDPEDMPVYLNKGQRMHMLFNFFVNQHFFLSLTRQNVTSLVRALNKLPPLSHNNQWLNFLRHHDELSLKLLKKKEKEEVFERFAPDEDMRIFNRGIRRRLAPMLDNDRTMLEFCYSLVFCLPGVPLIRYGDEIGMGDNLSLSGRASVHTPMQWSGAINAGFSSSGKNNLEQPVIDKGTYRFQKVNVMEENRNPESLLNWVERLMSTRKQCPEIGSGALQILAVSDKRILVHTYTLKNEKIFFVHNFSDGQIRISRKRLKLPDEQLFDIFSREPFNLDDEEITLEAHAYHWLRAPTAIRHRE